MLHHPESLWHRAFIGIKLPLTIWILNLYRRPFSFRHRLALDQPISLSPVTWPLGGGGHETAAGRAERRAGCSAPQPQFPATSTRREPAGTGVPDMLNSHEHDAPSDQEKCQKSGSNRDECYRRALSGQDPDHHASPGRAQPRAEASRPDGQRPSPCSDRHQPDGKAAKERPGGLPDPRHAVPVTMGVPADRHENEHAAGVRRHGGCDRAGSGAHPATVSDRRTAATGPGARLKLGGNADTPDRSPHAVARSALGGLAGAAFGLAVGRPARRLQALKESLGIADVQ